MLVFVRCWCCVRCCCLVVGAIKSIESTNKASHIGSSSAETMESFVELHFSLYFWHQHRQSFHHLPLGIHQNLLMQSDERESILLKAYPVQHEQRSSLSSTTAPTFIGYCLQPVGQGIRCFPSPWTTTSTTAAAVAAAPASTTQTQRPNLVLI